MKAHKHLFPPVIVLLMFFSVFCLGPVNGYGQQGGEEEEESVVDKVKWVAGPAVADLDKWAEIKVPEGYLFANGPDTKMLMEAMGNPLSDTEVGFLAPETLDWFMVFEFDEVGYIRDDEKDSLDGDAILESIKRGTEEGNKIRKENGFPGLHIVGWDVPPRYNEETHNLEWAIRAKDDDGQLSLNYNTRILGRRGVMRVTLVLDPEIFSSVLPVYSERLSGFAYKSGNKYAEYVQGDKIAAYGLTALVAGGAGAAAAKFGLFKWLAKAGKGIFVAILAFFGAVGRGIKKIFSKKKQDGAQTVPE